MLTFLVAALPAARAQIVPVSLVHDATGDSKIPSGVVLAPLPAQRVAPGGEARAAEIDLLVDLGGLHRRRAGHAAIRIHVAELRRERSFHAAVFPAAGVLRFRCLVCHGNQLSGMEHGAIRVLAQDLVGSAGMLDGGKPSGIRIHAGASIAALMRCGAEIMFAHDVRSD
jgi:hypothetical protein